MYTTVLFDLDGTLTDPYERFKAGPGWGNADS
jgi:phosphoglycolate phosphatase-like HAD superfamily hydrolase